MAQSTYNPSISADGDLLEEQLYAPLRYLVQDRTDFVSKFLSTGQALSREYYNNTIEIGYFNFGTLATAITDGTSAPVTVEITKTAYLPNLLHTGTVLVIGTGFAAERFILTENPIDNSTKWTCNNCLRGANTQFATSPTTYSIGAEVFIEGGITPEGWEPTENYSQNGSRIPAYTEIIDPYSVIMTGTQLAIAPKRVGGEGKIEVQMARGMAYMVNLLQIHSIRRPSSSSGPSNSTTGSASNRTMRGLLDYATNYNGNVVDANSTSFTVDIFDDIIEETLLRGGISTKSSSGKGPMKMMAIMSDRQKKKLNPQLAGYIKQDPSNTTMTRLIMRYSSEIDIEIITLPKDCLRRDEVIVMPEDNFQILALTGRAWKERKIDDNFFDKEVRWGLGEYGTRIGNPSLISYYYRFAT